MTVQPTPSNDCMPGARQGADRPHRRVLALSNKALSVWPIQLEVEPWGP